MSPNDFLPLHEEEDRYLRHARLGPHIGRGSVQVDGVSNHPLTQILAKQHKAWQPGAIDFDACCVVPASGPCQIFLQFASDNRLTSNFGEGLRFSGDSADGPFELECPKYYVQSTSAAFEKPGWSIATPVNSALRIHYGPARPIGRVVGLINNFDFEHGNVCDPRAKRNPLPLLRLTAGGHEIELAWTEHREILRRLLDTEMLPSAATTIFSFAAWPEASEADLERFAQNIAGLCSVVAQQHTGIPVLSFLDADGSVIQRLVSNPVESQFRRGYVIRHLQLEGGLEQVFRQCFDEFVRIRDSELWQTMPSFCAGVEDPPYLEQKMSSLMAAIERLIRNSLVEGGHAECDDFRPLPELIGAARGLLRWDVPSHYTARGRYRLNRNAVDHGADLPDGAAFVRQEFDKWRLFLMRRYLLRLGFTGNVASPRRGWASISPVSQFTEEVNSFGATSPA